MKHLLSSKKLFIPITLLTLVACWNGSMVDSNKKDTKRPDLNVQATIETYNEVFQAEDVLLRGKYEDIAAYPDPCNNLKVSKKSDNKDSNKEIELDPKQNVAKLNLTEIKQIEAIFQEHPTASQIDINNRKYVKFQITFHNNSKDCYLFESGCDITCLKNEPAPTTSQNAMLEERKLSMIHIKKITFNGYKSGEDKIHKKYYDTEENKKKDEQAIASNQVSDTLDQIEKTVKNLPKDDHSMYEQIKQTLLSLLKSLRDQIQKLLYVLKK